MLTKHYRDLKVGDVVHAHGVPLVVTTEAITQPRYGDGALGDVVWVIATYRGPDMGPDSGLHPFVRRDGDTWSLQRRADLAVVVSYDGGQTWHQRP